MSDELSSPFLAEVKGIRAKVSASGLVGSQALELYQQELSNISNRDDREAAEILLFAGHNSGVIQMAGDGLERRHAQEREKRTFWVSVAFLLLVVLVSLFVHDPSPTLAGVLRLLMALSAGAFVASIPGLLSVEGKTKPFGFLDSFAVKATGGAAAFFLVYYYSPNLISK